MAAQVKQHGGSLENGMDFCTYWIVKQEMCKENGRVFIPERILEDRLSNFCGKRTTGTLHLYFYLRILLLLIINVCMHVCMYLSSE